MTYEELKKDVKNVMGKTLSYTGGKYFIDMRCVGDSLEDVWIEVFNTLFPGTGGNNEA